MKILPKPVKHKDPNLSTSQKKNKLRDGVISVCEYLYWKKKYLI